MHSKCCNRKSLLKVFTLFFLFNLVSAINIIQDLPDNLVAGSEYETIFSFNANIASNYNITVFFNNVSDNETFVRNCTEISNGTHICSRSQVNGLNLVSLYVSYHPYIQPSNYPISIIIESPSSVSPPPVYHSSSSSGGSGGGSLYIPRQAYHKEIKQNVTNITNSTNITQNVTEKTEEEVKNTDTPHYSTNILEETGMSFNIPKKKKDIKIQRIEFKPQQKPKTDDSYILAVVAAGIVVLVLGGIGFFYYIAVRG